MGIDERGSRGLKKKRFELKGKVTKEVGSQGLKNEKDKIELRGKGLRDGIKSERLKNWEVEY